jgi:hypothetical protein
LKRANLHRTWSTIPKQQHLAISRHALPRGGFLFRPASLFEIARDHAKFYNRSHDAVIRVFDAASNVIQTHEQATILLIAKGPACFRRGKIRILDSNGAVERVSPFNETERKL